MKRKHIIIGLIILLLGTVVAISLATRAGARSHGIAVSLVGYTNDPTGIPLAAYSTSNKTTGRFAVLRVVNPTRRDFFCFFGPIVLLPHDGLAEQTIPLTRSQTGDFDLAPRASTTIAVPEPEFAGRWRSIVVLCHRHSYSRGLWLLVRLTQIVGLDHTENNWFAVSPEIRR